MISSFFSELFSNSNITLVTVHVAVALPSYSTLKCFPTVGVWLALPILLIEHVSSILNDTDRPSYISMCPLSTNVW